MSEGNGKRCYMCKEWKPLTEFHRHRGQRDGRQNRCRDCNIAQAKLAHARDPERARARIKKRADRMREANHRALFAYLLDHPCVDCGEADPVVLQFDHLRDKKFNVSKLANSAVPFERVLAEIRKCEVVCANCHQRRTCMRIDGYRVRLLREIEAERRSA